MATPDRAGGLRNMMGSNFDPDDPQELWADIRLMVNQVERLIKEDQVKVNRPPSERLQALHLVDVIGDEQLPEVNIIVAVVNEEQQQEQAVVGI